MKITSLPAELNECSGMATLKDGYYVALNDSNNPAELYVFNLEKESRLKAVSVANAKNVDWEELAEDDTYVYIGDFGNNNGNRRNLRIYKVAKQDLMSADEVSAEIINFNYPQQLNFDHSNSTNFDCEAMVCIGDSLYLMTKNHGNLKTNLYCLSNKPGKYAAKLLGEYDAKGLVTGADYRNTGGRKELVLVGYTSKAFGYHPFVIYFNDVTGSDFFDSAASRIQLNGRLQIESVLFDDRLNLLISSEGKKKKDRNIYRCLLPNVPF